MKTIYTYYFVSLKLIDILFPKSAWDVIIYLY